MIGSARFALQALARASILLGASAALAGAAGCGTHRHALLGTEAIEPVPGPIDSPRGARAPLLCRTIELSISPSAAGRVPASAGRLLLTNLADALRRTRAFDAVTVAGGAPLAADLRVELVPESFDVTDSPSDDAGISVAGYLFLGFFSDWFHDRRCQLTCRFAAKLRDPRAGRDVGAVPRLQGFAADDLSFWERRGGAATAATIFFIPPMIFDTDTDRVASLLAPGAFDDAARTIVERIVALRSRDADVLRVHRYPLRGLSATVMRPQPELRAPTATAAPEPVIVRLAGDDVARLRKVWIGELVVYDAQVAAVAAGSKEMLLGRLFAGLRQRRSLLVTAQLEGAAPVALAEIELERVRVLEGK